MSASAGIVQQRERRGDSRFRSQNSFAQAYSICERQLGQHMSLFAGEAAFGTDENGNRPAGRMVRKSFGAITSKLAAANIRSVPQSST